MITALKLETPRDVAIHTQTLIALAYEARAERNQVALAFIGERIKPLMPEASLDAFKEDLKRVPAKPVAPEPAKDIVKELQEHIAKRDAVRPVAKVTFGDNVAPEPAKCADIEF